MARTETWIFERVGNGSDGTSRYKMAPAIVVNEDGVDQGVWRVTVPDTPVRIECVDSLSEFLAARERQNG